MTERFPSGIQAWILSQIEQVSARGGRVDIVAYGAHPGPYQSRVDELGLLEVTAHYPSTAGGVLRGLARFIRNRDDAERAWAREGLLRLAGSPWRPSGVRAWAKAVARAPVYAARGWSVVHSHNLTQAYEYRHVALLNDIPLVHTFHGLPPKGVATLPEPKRAELFGIVERALVNTRFARGQLETLGCPAEKIDILPQGIRPSEFEFRGRPPPTDRPIEVLTVGRLQPDKGIEHGIRAIASLRARGLDVRYTVVGEGPEAARLEGIARDLRIRSDVTFLGRVDDATLRRSYAAADIFLLPSVGSGLGDHTETQGVVIQEAQASGAIVAASRVGGIPECVDDGVSAFLFEHRNPDAIAMTIASILDQPERWVEWRRRGREWVERHFDIDLLGERLCRIYARIVAERERGGRKKYRDCAE